MPLQSENSPLGAFLAALREEGIDCILIGAMAAIRQGAPLMTVDYDFWVRLPEREYLRLLTICAFCRWSGLSPANVRRDEIRIWPSCRFW
jgi:hypothetical protein